MLNIRCRYIYIYIDIQLVGIISRYDDIPGS